MKAIFLSVLLTTFACSYRAGRLAPGSLGLDLGTVESVSALRGADTVVGGALSARLAARSSAMPRRTLDVRILRVNDRIAGANGVQREIFMEMELVTGETVVTVSGRQTYLGGASAPNNESARFGVLHELSGRLFDEALPQLIDAVGQ